MSRVFYIFFKEKEPEGSLIVHNDPQLILPLVHAVSKSRSQPGADTVIVNSDREVVLK